MKLNHLAQMFFLLIVFHQKVEEDPEMKGPLVESGLVS